MSLSYQLSVKDHHAHLFAVELILDNPNPLGQVFSLPNWIPGSYLIRDFSKHIVSMYASSQGQAVGIKKLDKNHWIAQPCDGPITLSYEVYAFDLSVRSAYVDIDRGFFNGSSVFLLPLGQEQQPCDVSVQIPDGWEIATTLTPAAQGFSAKNYAELIDHPVEMAKLDWLRFTVNDTRHSMAISGSHQADLDRLSEDLTRICQHHVGFFGDMPFDQYLFLTLVRTQGYGGLEHGKSTSLICSRKDLPEMGAQGVSKDYAKFLALCSHEYFHAWWVKTIKPSNFHHLDLNTENYTHQLWVYEGFTSYYDELSLLRSQLITPEAYLDLFAQSISRVQRAKGRLLQSLSESSYDAWTRFYQQDENAPNAIVSYYAKGALLSFVLDIELRKRSNDQHTLDDVLKYIWQHYQATGTEDNTVEKLCAQLTGTDFSEFFQNYVEDTTELPLIEAFDYVGIDCQFTHKADDLSEIGISHKAVEGRSVITQVLNQSCAHQAGLYVGDVIVAIDQIKVEHQALNGTVKALKPGQVITISVLRDDSLRDLSLTVAASEPTACVLTPKSELDTQTQQRQTQWFYGN